MKTQVGGDRIGSGNKMEVSMKNYSRSTHDLSSTWRSTMAPGTLVPFMNLVGLPGDNFEIDLNCEVLTLPTIGPLFGSFKVQLDVFQVPIRLYNSALHMNKLGIGMDMKNVFLPQMRVAAATRESIEALGGKWYDDNAQVNPSCLLKYLGISGVGFNFDPATNPVRRFNAVPFLGYWDIYKNYYANKQEEQGIAIHNTTGSIESAQTIKSALMFRNGILLGDINQIAIGTGTQSAGFTLEIEFGAGALKPDINAVTVSVDSGLPEPLVGTDWRVVRYDNLTGKWFLALDFDGTGADTYQLDPLNQTVYPVGGQPDLGQISPQLVAFDLNNIDSVREQILQAPTSAPWYVNDAGVTPYTWISTRIQPDGLRDYYGIESSQELLGVKTYQSDMLNNWISTEWIDGPNGINEITSVDTSSGSFNIDALNLANKVYTMLNRIAISGGSYDDWLDAVYTHERSRSVESPVYQGSLIRELAFQEVVSLADTETTNNEQPLGTLAGRGKLTSKYKGGKINVKIDEPSYIMGIVSLTPRIDVSTSNVWDVNLKTMDDFHKPELGAIGYQDLITEQMHWASTRVTDDPLDEPNFKSAGKQPAWINYMTDIDRTYGNFAIEGNQMFMTLNRQYEIDPDNGSIEDLTTYIDPVKYNQIFAQTSLDAQNFWVQISKKITARRKMTAKVIPNL